MKQGNPGDWLLENLDHLTLTFTLNYSKEGIDPHLGANDKQINGKNTDFHTVQPLDL